MHQKRVRNICFIFPKVYIDCTLLTVLTKLMHVTDVFIIDDRTFSINRDDRYSVCKFPAESAYIDSCTKGHRPTMITFPYFALF